MTTDARKTAERFFATLDSQQWDRLPEVVAPSVRAHMGTYALDRDGWIGFARMFFAAFPDGRHELASIYTAGDVATIVGTFRGTHRGEFQGIAPTGRTVALPFITVMRTSEGRCAEEWVQFDSAGLLGQLGALPSPDAADVVVRMLRACDAQDWAACEALVSPKATAHIGGQTMDRDAWLGFGKLFLAAFPDGHHELRDVLVAGDRVTTVATFTGTHRGAFMGIAPTGRRISFPVIHVDRIADGQIVEHRGEFDSALLARQLQ